MYVNVRVANELLPSFLWNFIVYVCDAFDAHIAYTTSVWPTATGVATFAPSVFQTVPADAFSALVAHPLNV